VHIFNRMVSE